VTSMPQATDLDRFRSVASRYFGLHFDDNRLAVQAEVLERRVVASRETSDAYLTRLESGAPPREEIRTLAQEISGIWRTTNRRSGAPSPTTSSSAGTSSCT
jgi:hypothetical protein